jgi:hypothetical protein
MMTFNSVSSALDMVNSALLIRHRESVLMARCCGGRARSFGRNSGSTRDGTSSTQTFPHQHSRGGTRASTELAMSCASPESNALRTALEQQLAG